MLETIRLSDIKPNPNRDLERNPLVPEKVERLKDSIQRLGWWRNCPVRKNGVGDYEVVYGHHRLEALRRLGFEAAEFNVENYDDAQMVQILSEENEGTYRHDVRSLIESVRGVVKALDEGRIPPFDIPEKTRKSYIYYAPFFVPGKIPEHPDPKKRFTITEVAKFLNKDKWQVSLPDPNGRREKIKPGQEIVAAIGALHLIELGLITETEIKGWHIEELASEVALRKQGYEKTVLQRQRSQEEQKRLYEEQMRLQREREAIIEAEKKRLDELVEEAREARQKEEAEKDVRLEEERALRQEQYEARLRRIQAQDKPDPHLCEELRRKADEDAKRKQRDAAFRGELNTALLFLQRLQEPSADNDRLRRLSKNPKLSTGEREIVRQSVMSAGDYFLNAANMFLPPRSITPAQELEVFRQKEEMARKQDEASEFYDEFAQKLLDEAGAITEN